MEEVEASMLAAAIRLSLQEAGGSGPAAQPQQLGPTGPASLKTVCDASAPHIHTPPAGCAHASVHMVLWSGSCP